MDWLGIGVLLIGIALLIISFVLIKPLSKLSDLLGSVQKTTDRLPTTVTTITEQTKSILTTTNDTLSNVNQQVVKVNPFMDIVEEVGEASHHIAAKTLDRSQSLKEKAAFNREVAQKQKYEGLYSLVSFIFVLLENKSNVKNSIQKISEKS